jgi:hypothetical protein
MCTSGIFDIAHPDAVVMSTEFVQIIPFGDVLLFFKEKIVYAPTLLPMALGKTRILFFRVWLFKS